MIADGSEASKSDVTGALDGPFVILFEQDPLEACHRMAAAFTQVAILFSGRLCVTCNSGLDDLAQPFV